MSKYYLEFENNRNTHHGMIFIELIKRAFEVDEVVMVGHHFVFEPEAAMKVLDLTKLNEIPSADTLLFDHYIMFRVFGEQLGRDIMARMAQASCDERDAIVAAELAKLPPMAEPVKVAA